MTEEIAHNENALVPTRFGMLKKFALLVRLFFVWIYARVVHEPTQVREVLSVPPDETVIYLLGSENKHDFLFLNDLCLRTGMPLAYAGNGDSNFRYGTLGTRIAGLFKGRRKKFEPDEIAELAAQHRPIILFLNQYGRHEIENTAKTTAIFEALAQKVRENPDLKIHFFPVGVIWERRMESMEISRFNEIYGTPTRPSSVRRFLSVLPGLGQLFFQIGQPLCLIHHHVLDKEFSEQTASEMRIKLDDDVHMMHTQVNGPKVKPHQQLLREIIESEPFQNELHAISQQSGQSHEELVLEARKILDKTASKFSLVVCKMFTTVLMPMWSIIYNGLYVDQEQFNRIRELSKTHRLVFIPSHKSHIDYLVLSILLFQNGVLPPHIAAGENLNFFPVGGILRRGGAFFIRRSFRGEQLYTACIRYYIDKIMHEGYPVEFFIEGGRSRTGQVLQPKFGILRMIAQAVQSDPSLPVKIIPCAITYEKVIEDMAYKNEQDGAVKQKENFSNLIRTTKLLISKYGQLYVSFAEPIDLNEVLHVDDPAHEQSDQSLTEDIDIMAVDLMQRINQASTITMSALLSCAFLNMQCHSLAIDSLLEGASFLLLLLIDRGALISPVLRTVLEASRASLHDTAGEDMAVSGVTDAVADRISVESLIGPLRQPIMQTLELFEHNGTIKKRGDKNAPEIEIALTGRLQMAFYKNILLYAIIDDIYVAGALLIADSADRDRIFEEYSAIADLFSIELTDVDGEARFEKTIRLYEKRKWIEIADNEIRIVPGEEEVLIYMARCMAHHTASYRYVFDAFAEISGSVEESKWMSNLMAQAKIDVAAHKILPESRTKVVYTHALQKLQKLGCLDVSYEQMGRKSAKYLSRSGEIPQRMAAIMDALSEKTAFEIHHK